MGLIAVHFGSTPWGSPVSVLANPDVQTGGIFVTAALVCLLAYLNVLEASERDRRRLRALLVVSILPLTFVFVVTVALRSLAAIGGL